LVIEWFKWRRISRWCHRAAIVGSLLLITIHAVSVFLILSR
jgi:hypothetical protein